MANLKELEKLMTPELEEKYRYAFETEARYLNSGIYEWCSIAATDTRMLFVLGVLAFEGIVDKEGELL